MEEIQGNDEGETDSGNRGGTRHDDAKVMCFLFTFLK